MAEIIRFFLADVPVWAPIVAIVLAMISIKVHGRFDDGALVVDRLLAYLLFFVIGIQSTWAGFMHMVFPQLTAALIGWPSTPFQWEVGMADVSFGILGLCAFFASFGFRAATTIGISLYLFGAGLHHIQMIHTMHDYAPGNTGLFLYEDLITPVILVLLLILHSIWPVQRRVFD